jgi:signal transduction histidine kinase
MIPSLEERAGEYLRELAHDVGNALHPMQLLTQILSQPNLTPEIVERLRRGLESQLPSMQKLLDDLRRVSLIARNACEPKLQSLDAKTLLRNTADLFRQRPGAEERSLEVHIADDLPRVQADPDLLEKSVLELLSNAARHAAPGGLIQFTAHAEGNEVVISVADDGEGIAPELLPHVFELFVRGDADAIPTGDRFGVGLTFVRQIAHKHGGRVAAESAGPGRGATFTIRLPACAEKIGKGLGANRRT